MKRVSLAVFSSLLGCGSTSSTPVDAERGAPAVPEREQGATYMGRELAQTMSHRGAGWLTRAERDEEEDTTSMHANLGLEPGDVACDFGAGNGYHTLRLAKAVGPTGKAIGVDLQPQMLELLRERAAEEKVANVETILATDVDPNLPSDTCDLILLVDVYHELADPAAVLGHLGAALTEDGRIALLEYREEDPQVPIKALHKMSKAQIMKEYAANGLALESEYDGLPWQHMMFFVPKR